MGSTALDGRAPCAARIVVDVQQEYFDGILQIQYPPRDESLANVARALDVAERHDLPTVVVQHEYPAGAPVFAAGSAGWALHPDVEKRAAGVNCDLATAASAEEPGLTAEVLSDATGAIHLANDAGSVPARVLHETLLTLLNSK